MKEYKKIPDFCPIDIPPPGCPDIFPRKPKPPKPPKKKRICVENEICGYINQNCNGEFVEYWKGIGISPIPSGTVTVLNTSGCNMTVRADIDGDGIPDITLFNLTEENQTKSVTINSIASIEVSCEGEENQKCTGTFCIDIHYEKGILKENE
ncbi:S-Ena type endospore appendage [Bacillus sp. FJAT-47783]|uniref:S-Ena type endospore appendage n=1 Tax=Bacillus sp. FJAT-47783 TaxID=2922712 RepID=UPI001FAC4333|nr:S-Ena type endospore appendage [Bacillus sp. FJAT-47783]